LAWATVVVGEVTPTLEVTKMLAVTPSAITKLKQMCEEQPDKGAFRVVFKGHG